MSDYEKHPLADREQTGIEHVERRSNMNLSDTRRSQREIIYTEKGREYKLERIRQTSQKFQNTYDKWKKYSKEVKNSLTHDKSQTNEDLQEKISKVKLFCRDLATVYEDIRRNCTPDQEIRRKMDTCKALSDKLVEYAEMLLASEKSVRNLTPTSPQLQQLELNEISSLFSSAHVTSTTSSVKASKKSGRSVISINSDHSSRSGVSSRKLEAAAELAACQAELRALKLEERKREEILKCEFELKERKAKLEAEACRRRMEQQAEEARISAEIEMENTKLHQSLEEKRHKLEQLEAINRVNIARSKVQVYEEDYEEDEDFSEFLKNCEVGGQT